jgi:hypothetical protein
MTKAELIQIISGFIGTLGFTVLFNIRGNALFSLLLAVFYLGLCLLSSVSLYKANLLIIFLLL